MKSFVRFLLVGTFIVLGIGLAACLAVVVLPADESPEPPTRQLVAWAHSEDDSPSTPVKPAELPALEEAKAKPLTPVTAVTVEPHPLYAAQPIAPKANPALEDALDYLQQRLAPPPAASTEPTPPVPQPPAPAANEVLPAPLPSAATGRSPAGGNAAAVKSVRPVVKADPAGDGKLSIHIQNSDLREVLDLLSEQGGLNILAGKDVQGKVSATLSGVDIQSALEAILRSTGYVMRRHGEFIFVGTPDEFNNMEQALDRVGTRVFRPNYVTAAELKALIQPLLTERIGVVSVSSPAEAGIAANDATAGGDKFAGGEVVLVRDYQAVLTQIDQMVAEVDCRPLQVSIEAMILSVKLDDTNQFGVNFELLRDHMKFGWGTPAAGLSDFKFDKGGLKFGYLDAEVGVFVDALEQIADTNVIATPRLMVINKHRAEILIGDKIGYVSTTVTETASTQTVDFLETGAQLRLRPFISRDGLIRMEVHPELSDGFVEVTDKFTLPQKSVTEVTTNIMVRDGCTVIIGGLMKDQLTTSSSAVPLLGSMPWIGGLFRSKKETTERREVVVLITPRIIYEPGSCQEGDKAACEFQRRQAVYAEKMSPLGRRSIARRYIRLAQTAWASRDRDTALRFAEMAVHFDPESRAAIDLRAEIWQEKSCGEALVVSPPTGAAAAARAPASAEVIDGPEIPDWMLKDLKKGPASPSVKLLHPLDPGQPGTQKEIVRPRSLQ